MQLFSCLSSRRARAREGLLGQFRLEQSGVHRSGGADVVVKIGVNVAAFRQPRPDPLCPTVQLAGRIAAKIAAAGAVTAHIDVARGDFAA